MAYKMFLSCADEDKQIALNIKKYFESMFGHNINIYFYGQIRQRTRWQEPTRKALKDSDALITILSPIFINKHWAFIEFTPFWLFDKDIFILCLEDNLPKKTDLPLMRHYNYFQVKDHDEIVRFLESIGQAALKDEEWKIPNSKIVNSFKEAFKEGIEKAGLHQTIFDDYAEFLAIRQYENGDYSGLIDTLELIIDDAMKKHIALHIHANKNYELTIDVLKTIYEMKFVRQFTSTVYRLGQYTADFMDALLEILENDNAELRNFAKYLIDTEKWKTDLFDDLIYRMTNNAEIRNVAKYFIYKNGFTKHVKKMTDLIANDAELKNLLIAAIRKEQYDNDNFRDVAKMIINEKHQRIVLHELQKIDSEYAKKYFMEKL